jgi:hypothetical protein
VTGSEFAFLAFGLLLGVAAGAALIEILRARPPSKREVRVTVTPNSIARRRSATLADVDAYAPPTGPARGGPGDRRLPERDLPEDDPAEVPEDDAEPAFEIVAGSHLAAAPHLRNGTGNGTPVPVGSAARRAGGRDSIGISISHEPDPMMTALRAKGVAGAGVLMPSGIESSAVVASAASTEEPPVPAWASSASAETLPRPAAAVATMPRPEASSAAGGKAATSEEVAQGRSDAIAGACDEPRRIADERCQVATRAREGAGAALETLRSAQHAYDEHVNKAEAQAATSDPRTVRTAKEAAQQAFREAREAGRTRDDIETAARDWLTEINRINLATRESSALAERHRRAAVELAANLERLSVEADAARISAEMAEEACVAAREAVAACQEAAAVLAAGGRKSSPVPKSGPADAERRDGDADETEGSMGSRAGEDAVIIKLLRGDREALGRLVARLAGDDSAERRRWQLAIGGFLEAVIARSIEATAFDFPTEHPFWGPFTRSQCRDIAAALSSLGYKHDGFGGWADDRMPSQRDLSLAVGYAGLDPMRIRHWPSDSEMVDLLRDVTVAADEYIWEAAGTLTLGELVSLLGRRADALTELWNEWGLVRPLLLAAD